jgi:hypothetical protein
VSCLLSFLPRSRLGVDTPARLPVEYVHAVGIHSDEDAITLAHRHPLAENTRQATTTRSEHHVRFGAGVFDRRDVHGEA